jgi:hypothetical protein
MRGRDFILATLWILAPFGARAADLLLQFRSVAIATARYESCGAASPAPARPGTQRRAAVFPQTERAVLCILREDCRTRPL